MAKKKEETFEVLPEHILILESMTLYWEDDFGTGAPVFDSKRPFGFSGAIEGDILEIIGDEVGENVYKFTYGGEEYTVEDFEYDDDVKNILWQLYRDTETVLQITIDTKQLKAGVYKKVDGRWKVV